VGILEEEAAIKLSTLNAGVALGIRLEVFEGK